MVLSPRSLLFLFLSLSPLVASRLSPDSQHDHQLAERVTGAGPEESFAVVQRNDKTRKLRTSKYFREAGGSHEMSHYDKRYFVDKVPYGEHRLVLRDLIRSYLGVMQSHGVETWLAHGTLLGWWWNGQIMPWDYDLDVQVSNNTLQWLADNLNRTEHEFGAAAGDETEGSNSPSASIATTNTTRKYLLDVNPHHVDLTKGDGMNVIDARWIDMSNGMFIDITSVRERNMRFPGQWSCKNKHKYESKDLWPMRVSQFEGSRVRIPYGFQKILSDEYGHKSLVLEIFHKHRWNRDIKEWVAMTDEENRNMTQQAKEKKLAAMGST